MTSPSTWNSQIRSIISRRKEWNRDFWSRNPYFMTYFQEVFIRKNKSHSCDIDMKLVRKTFWYLKKRLWNRVMIPKSLFHNSNNIDAEELETSKFSCPGAVEAKIVDFGMSHLVEESPESNDTHAFRKWWLIHGPGYWLLSSIRNVATSWRFPGRFVQAGKDSKMNLQALKSTDI